MQQWTRFHNISWSGFIVWRVRCEEWVHVQMNHNYKNLGFCGWQNFGKNFQGNLLCWFKILTLFKCININILVLDTVSIMYDYRYSKLQSLPLCLKTLILAPDNLAPSTSDEWFSSSLTIKSPLPTRVGMLVELVAKPIPNAIAAGLPRKRATRVSSSSWRWRVPDEKTVFQLLQINVQFQKISILPLQKGLEFPG